MISKAKMMKRFHKDTRYMSLQSCISVSSAYHLADENMAALEKLCEFTRIVCSFRSLLKDI